MGNLPETNNDPLFAICDRYSDYSYPRAIFMLFNPSQTAGGLLRPFSL